MSAAKITPFIKTVWENFLNAGGFDARVLSELKIVSSEQGRVKCELVLQDQHLNRLKTVHGGLLSTIIDIGGSLAVASNGLHATGVSTDLNITFVSAAKAGDRLDIDARLDKLGKTLAFTSVELKSQGRLIAHGRHTKFVALAHKDPKNITITEQEEHSTS